MEELGKWAICCHHTNCGFTHAFRIVYGYPCYCHICTTQALGGPIGRYGFLY